MTPQDAPFSDDPTTAAPEAAARSLVEEQAAILGRLAEIGLSIAAALERQALAQDASASAPHPAPSLTPSPAPVTVHDGRAPSPPPPPSLSLDTIALAYARVARAVRQSLMLQARLLADAKAAAERDASIAHIKSFSEAPEQAQRAAARKARIERIVLRVAEAAAPVCEASGELDAPEGFDSWERLEQEVAETLERYDDEDIWGSVLARPVSAVVEQVCRDLGLTPDWTVLVREAWAQEELAGDAIGPPLARFKPAATLRPASPARREPRPIKPPERWPRPPGGAPDG